jgi:hypothetical protein
VSKDPALVAKHLTDAYMGASPSTQRELQGRVTGRVFTSMVVTGRTGPILGPIVSAVAVGGNMLDAGTTWQNEAAVIDAALFGE